MSVLKRYTGAEWEELGGTQSGTNVALGFVKHIVDQTFTTEVEVSSLTKSVTVPAGHLIRVKAVIPTPYASTTANSVLELAVFEGATQLQRVDRQLGPADTPNSIECEIAYAPSAGTYTYSAKISRVVGAGTGHTNAGATKPAFLLIEDLGLVPA